MIVILKPGTPEAQEAHLTGWLEQQGLQVHAVSSGSNTILGLVGDTRQVDRELLLALDFVQAVRRLDQPFRLCSRDFHPQPTVISLSNGVKIGGGAFCLIAGPCSVETRDQIVGVARDVKAAGATLLRGGAFKPRTSPYDFQGLGAQGIELLLEAKKETGLPIVTELMNAAQLPLFEEVDVIQIGARNMQNFDLLKEVGRLRKPILLKRGLCATIKEWLMSAEYIMSEGNEQVILCERGIRTYETQTRNSLDLSSVPALRELTHLPIFGDPSHATGRSRLVPPMALAATAAGCDGLMIEVHNDPPHAWCDGPQSLTPAQFARVAEQVRKIREVLA